MTDTLVESSILLIPTTDVDGLAVAMDRLDTYLRRGQELKAAFNAAMFERVQEQGMQRIKLSDGNEIIFTIGHPKETKCSNVAKTLQILLEESGGDFERVCECLSANAFKYGQAKKALADSPGKWDECFEVTVKDKLEKELIEINTKFLPKGTP